MGGCSAAGCSNSSSKGFSMHMFPTDVSRRTAWEQNMKRVGGWTSSAKHLLCEVHFAADQWEKPRVDGKKKLKCNAVPTQFICAVDKPHRKHQRQKNKERNSNSKSESDEYSSETENNVTIRKTSTILKRRNLRVRPLSKKRMKVEKRNSDNSDETDGNDPLTSDSPRLESSGRHNTNSFTVILSNSSVLELMSQNTGSNVSTFMSALKDKNITHEMILTKRIQDLERENLNANNMLVKQQRQISSLTKQLQKLKEESRKQTAATVATQQRKSRRIVDLLPKSEDEIMKVVFNEDQLNCLETNSEHTLWTESTMKTALQIRIGGGLKLYKDLLAKNFPLPSRRTLSRTMSKFNFKRCTGISDGLREEVFRSLREKQTESLSEMTKNEEAFKQEDDNGREEFIEEEELQKTLDNVLQQGCFGEDADKNIDDADKLYAALNIANMNM